MKLKLKLKPKPKPKHVLACVLAVNAAVAVLFLWLSSQQWIEPELRDEPGARGGGALVFAVTVFQLGGPMLALNVAWLVYATTRATPPPDRSAAILQFALIGVAWCGLLYLSASRL